MHDPKYVADLTIKKGKREPGIPASVRGSIEPYVVETPIDLMRKPHPPWAQFAADFRQDRG